MKPTPVFAAILTVAVFGSSLAVIVATEQTRREFARLQELSRNRDKLEVEFGRLQLEQGTLAAPGRVGRLARRDLHMELPKREDVIVVNRPPMVGRSSKRNMNQ